MGQDQQKSNEVAPIKYRYHAFISYAHEDKKTVEWLRKLLATFWVPWKLRRRIFLDQESLPAGGGLSDTLKTALQESRFLIVCCSDAAVESRWVDLEVDEFLESHSPKNVLACLVGSRKEGPFAVPHSVRGIEEDLNDDLFKPDLRGNPETLSGAARQVAIRDALSLLAPLVGLRGKDELLDRRKKTLIFGTALILLVVSVTVGWKLWDNRPASQINKILSESPYLVNTLSTNHTSSKADLPTAAYIADPAEDRHSVTGEWLRTLILTAHSTDALEAARKIQRADARLHAMIEVAEQLSKGGSISHYIDHWGKRSWEIVTGPRERSNDTVVGDQARRAANDAVQAGNEVVAAARGIENAGSRFEVMARVIEALGKIGKSTEAALVAHEALEPARNIEDASSRIKALTEIIKSLANAGQNDEAGQITAEVVRAVGNIPDARSRDLALSRVATALAEAGNSVKALETADKIEDAGSRSYAQQSIVEALVKAGRSTDARSAALQITQAEDRTKALVELVNELLKANKNDQAVQAANDAVESERQLKFDLQGRFTATVWVIEMLAKVGRIDEALEMVRRASDPNERCRTLTWVVEVLLKDGRHAEASRVANEAVAAARLIKDGDDRPAALIAIAESLAHSDHSEEVIGIANEALVALDQADYLQMDRIVQLLSKVGKNEEAKQVADKELSAIRKLPSGNTHIDTLTRIDIVSLMARSGTSAEARQAAHAAVVATQQRKFEWEANRVWALVAIVGTLAKAGKSAEAIETAGEIGNPTTRILALVRIAEELANVREAEKAWTVISTALGQAQQFTSPADKSYALAEVAKGLAKLRYFRLAREAVESASPADKLAVYTVILREYSIERNPSLASSFEAERPQ